MQQMTVSNNTILTWACDILFGDLNTAVFADWSNFLVWREDSTWAVVLGKGGSTHVTDGPFPLLILELGRLVDALEPGTT